MEELRIAVASDIHLNHARNETSFILSNLRREFPDNEETGMLDIIVFAGDVFDGLLTVPEEEHIEISNWVADFLRMCKKRDITLIVLEGTPSHDRFQSQIFEVFNRTGKINADLLYVKTLSIHYLKKFGINVLFVPDEWSETSEETLHQVKQLLTTHGLEKVDYAFMHGQFEYQLPEVVKAPKHDSKEYLKIVDKLIFIGHVHVFSSLDRIFAQGSFDRLSHGEEGPKGHLRAVIRSRDDYSVTFVENKGARIFKTIHCIGLDLSEILQQVEIQTKDIPDGSFVRISCSADNPINQDISHLVRYRPNITWSMKVDKTDEKKYISETDDDLSKNDFVSVEITPRNIYELVMDRIKKTSNSARVENVAGEILLELR